MIEADVKRVAGQRCVVFLDVDETLLNPLYRWRERLSEAMGLQLSVEAIEMAGGLDNLFHGDPRHDEFAKIAENLREDEAFNSNLPRVDGAALGVARLMQLGVTVGGYLTGRPAKVRHVTEMDLAAKGFPSAPLIVRPENVQRWQTASWKVAVLDEIASRVGGTIVMVDDNPSVAEAVLERNRRAARVIAVVLFNGPLTRSLIMTRKLRTNIAVHFYVAEWEEIPGICRRYMGDTNCGASSHSSA